MYESIIRRQLETRIVEKLDEGLDCHSREFYIAHLALVRATAQTTKVRIVYNASANVNLDCASLNDCLETNPYLENMIWDILARLRFFPILLCGDIEKAFLEIQIREAERDALHFHWVKYLDSKKIETLVFGLTQSHFVLERVLRKHF